MHSFHGHLVDELAGQCADGQGHVRQIARVVGAMVALGGAHQKLSRLLDGGKVAELLGPP